MAGLTALAVENAKPGPARREIPDTKPCGLYLVVQPSGAKSWAFRYRIAGVTRKLTIGAFPGIDLKAARKKAIEAKDKIGNDTDPAAEKRAKIEAGRAARKAAKEQTADRDLVEKIAASFVERYAKANTRESSWRETERLLNREVVAAWKGRRLSTVTRADVHELLDGIVDRGSPILANRTLAALRKMCSWAVERGIVESSPCDKVKAPSAERSRDRVLADEELRAVWGACDGIGWPFGPLFRVLILTGQRRDEVGSMRWSELDLDAKLWTLPRERSKNDQAHVVPLSEPVVAILRALPRVGPYVFSTNGRAPVAGFSRAKERVDKMAGALPRWTLHDLRRTAATGMARLGIALPVVEKVLNHTSGSFAGIVGVYQRHGFTDEKCYALDTWAAFVERLVADDPAGNVVALKARAS